MVVEQRSKLGGCYQLRKSAGGEPDRVHGPLTHLAPACRVTTLGDPSRVQYNGVVVQCFMHVSFVHYRVVNTGLEYNRYSSVEHCEA